MRSILRCTTLVEKEELETRLSTLNWWPSLGQNDPIVQERATDIVSHIAEQDRELAKKTLLFTLYDDTTKTWGIVSKPAPHLLTFRLKNAVSERLKTASEKLVADLQPLPSDQGKNRKAAFDFMPRVEVLEPNSQDHAYSGEVLPPRRFLLALRERKSAAYVGIFTGVLMVILAILSSPPLKTPLISVLSPEWQQWISGNLERLTTAALITTVISWFEVLLHWFEIRQKNSIRWQLD